MVQRSGHAAFENQRTNYLGRLTKAAERIERPTHFPSRRVFDIEIWEQSHSPQVHSKRPWGGVPGFCQSNLRSGALQEVSPIARRPENGLGLELPIKIFSAGNKAI